MVKDICTSVAVMYLGNIMESGDTKTVFRNPQHPYTQTLLSAVLDVDVDSKKERIVLEGDIPSPIDPPPGCRFCKRCPYAMPQCENTAPALRLVEPGHFVACHRVEAAKKA